MGTSDQFTPAKFAVRVLRVMGVVMLIFFPLLIFASYIFMPGGKSVDFDLPFSVPGFTYLSFIAGWGLAYAKYFRFPENQKLLILGCGIGGILLCLGVAAGLLLSGEQTFSKIAGSLPTSLFGGFVGAALQLYFLVICARFSRLV